MTKWSAWREVKRLEFTRLWIRKWQPTPVFLPGESHGQRSLVSYSPWGRKESDTTEQLHFHFTRLGLSIDSYNDISAG